MKAFENRTKDEDPGQRLPVIFPGCLLNFCNETPQAVETLAKFKCASSVLKNILNTKTNDAVFNSSILFIHAMVECETGVRFFFLLTNLFIYLRQNYVVAYQNVSTKIRLKKVTSIGETIAQCFYNIFYVKVVFCFQNCSDLL